VRPAEGQKARHHCEWTVWWKGTQRNAGIRGSRHYYQGGKRGKAAQKVKPSLAILPKGDLYGAVYDAPLVEGKPRIKRNRTVPGEVVHNDRGTEMRDDLDRRRGAGVDDVNPEVGAGQMKAVNFNNTTCMSGVASGCKEAAAAVRLDKLQ